MLFTDYVYYNLNFPKEFMQNYIYFAPTSFNSNQTCYPFMFTPSSNCPIILFHQQLSNSLQMQNSKEISSIQCQVETAQHQTEEVKESSTVKSPSKFQKKGRNSHSKHQDDEFKLRPTSSQGVVYKKKNTESNIINQVFSYLYTTKSRNSVLAFFNKDQQKTNAFYLVMTKLKQANKKYMNRKFLKKLIDLDGDFMLERAVLKAKSSSIQISQIRRLLRALIFHFLRENVNLTLLTSAKIYKSTLPEHFWRKRQILRFLFGKNEEQQ